MAELMKILTHQVTTRKVQRNVSSSCWSLPSVSSCLE
jgi:hypothetical protein